MREFSVFAVNLLIVVGVFSVIYMCIYLLTSKIYYKIVSLKMSGKYYCSFFVKHKKRNLTCFKTKNKKY